MISIIITSYKEPNKIELDKTAVAKDLSLEPLNGFLVC